MKHINKLTELIDHEMGNMSYYNDNHKIELQDSEDNTEWYDLSITGNDDKFYCVSFRVTSDKIEVDIGEVWYEIEYFEPSIKWFWIALLSNV